MFFEQYAGELITFTTGIVGVIIGKITNRKRENVNAKELEVKITDKLLKIIMVDIVDPLREELAIARDELKKLKNAINKRYTCRNNADCPISVGLQKQQDSDRKRTRRKPATNRQREPVAEDNDETGDNSSDNGQDDDTPGQLDDLAGWS
jgi:hypothetical protein